MLIYKVFVKNLCHILGRQGVCGFLLLLFLSSFLYFLLLSSSLLLLLASQLNKFPQNTNTVRGDKYDESITIRAYLSSNAIKPDASPNSIKPSQFPNSIKPDYFPTPTNPDNLQAWINFLMRKRLLASRNTENVLVSRFRTGCLTT